MNATLANGFMVRYLDYNDMGGGGHNSEAIPALLAVAEREKRGGRDFLTALVISYEIGARITASVIGPNFEPRGWTVDCRTGLSMPAPIGKLMRLNEEQMANAIAISGAHAPSLGILDSDREELAMAKDLRFGFPAAQAILACLLAKRGFTGFIRVVEGEKGFREVLLNNEMDLERLVDFSGWRILGGAFKTICQNWTTQAHILATLALVQEHDLKPSDIAAVRVRTSPRDARHVTTPAKRYPRNTESATHSAFFGNAIVIKERALGPEQLRPEKFNDPVVLELIEKITVVADPSLGGEFTSGGVSEITTNDGRRLEKRMDAPRGGFTDPLTDAEVEDKFKRTARLCMDAGKIEAIIDTVWNVDKLETVEALTKLMVWE
jgi:2-methylcitrate dehydratase